MISGVANPDEIERFQYGYSLTRPMMLDTNNQNKYIIPVQKMCSAQIEVTAKDENEAKQKAESLKYDMILNWR